MPDYYGHRGNKKFIENTMDAISNCKYNGIEIDVRLTIDNEIILHHDPTLKRIYNIDEKISKLEYYIIKKLCNSVVLLEECLNYCNKHNMKVIIDIKEKCYNKICYIIDFCIDFCKKGKFDLNNIIFLCWYDLIKPRKNIKFYRVLCQEYISSDDLEIYKHELFFDGISINYTENNQNIKTINKIIKKNFELNIYTESNLKDLKYLKYIFPKSITL